MNNNAFIQVGRWIFATAHITAINLNDATANFDPAVSLRIVGDNEPWMFRHGTAEAEAITAFVESLADGEAHKEDANAGTE